MTLWWERWWDRRADAWWMMNSAINPSGVGKSSSGLYG